MATYVILNGLVLSAVVAAAIMLRRSYVRKSLLLSLSVMILLTAIFDSLIIKSGIVAYDTSLISGISIIAAPIEDFAYCVAAVLLMPILWKLAGRA